MRNIYQEIHKGKKLPRTFDQGRRALDIIAVNKNVTNEMIDRAGIISFYTLNASDHRAMYIDIKAEHLYEDVKVDEKAHNEEVYNKKCEDVQQIC